MATEWLSCIRTFHTDTRFKTSFAILKYCSLYLVPDPDCSPQGSTKGLKSLDGKETRGYDKVNEEASFALRYVGAADRRSLARKQEPNHSGICDLTCSRSDMATGSVANSAVIVKRNISEPTWSSLAAYGDFRVGWDLLGDWPRWLRSGGLPCCSHS